MTARRAVLVLCLLLPLAVPQAAGAAFATRAAGGVLTVNGGSEGNTVTISLSGSNYMVTDQAGMGEGPGCSHVDATTSSCVAAPVTSFTADLGDGNDKFSSTAPIALKVTGAGGTDDISGGPMPDDLTGGDDNDTLHGGPGNDMLTGEAVPGASTTGQNTMDGGDGNDTIEGGSGPDMVTAGADDDFVNAGGGSDNVDGGEGSDTVGGGNGDDIVHGGPGADHVGLDPDPQGQPRERGRDLLDGGPGDDMIDPGAGPLDGIPDGDTMMGGDGLDRVSYAARTAPLLITVGVGADDGVADEGDNVGPDVESIAAGSGDDHVRGGPGPARLSGGPGAATVHGGDGADILDGGPGPDTLGGGPGPDSVGYPAAVGPVTVTLDNQPGDGPVGEGDNVLSDVENVGGGAGADTFTGSGGANALDPADGEDYADGGAGSDLIRMGSGFDVARARDGETDDVDCGPDSDFAIVDAGDRVSSTCERVDRSLRKRRPRLRRLVLVRPRGGGAAFFGLAGMHRTVPLRDRIGLPLAGTRLDASQGAIELTAARTASGGSQQGTFSRGAFLVKQPRSRVALTELVLTGGADLSKCTSRSSRVVQRRLFGRARGRFRTRGRFSTATVRGTVWRVEDRCDGTLTTVKSGRVVVRDRVKHRTVRLKGGQRYLARRGNR